MSEAVATTTVTRDDHYYNMSHNKQGFAYIFSHDEFSSNNLKRNAADVDETNLKNCLNNLGFEVRPFKNLKKAEIQRHIEEVCQMDHTNNNCFLVFVLSHGDANKVEALDGVYDPSEMFWNRFTADKCPSLAGKPKLFFMQCCQGNQLDPGIKLIYTTCYTETDGHVLPYTIPIHSDFCIMYATAKDHFAFRNEKKGSYFVKCLCEELEKYAYREHLLTILTFVIRRVAVEFESKSREPCRNKKKQIPYFESSLTRLLQFKIMKKEE